MLEEIGKWIEISGKSVYVGRPCAIKGEEKDFALKAEDRLYFYIHDLAVAATEQVVMGRKTRDGKRHFSGKMNKIKGIRWADNGEALSFEQTENGVTVDCTGYPYGKSLVVRVAEVTF